MFLHESIFSLIAEIERWLMEMQDCSMKCLNANFYSLKLKKVFDGNADLFDEMPDSKVNVLFYSCCSFFI